MTGSCGDAGANSASEQIEGLPAFAFAVRESASGESRTAFLAFVVAAG